MSTAVMSGPISTRSSRLARIAGGFYLLTFLTGALAFFIRGGTGIALGLIAGASYVVVTFLLYELFKPVNGLLSLIAAVVGLAGCALGALDEFHLLPFRINSLGVFGIYCVLIGSLILQSKLLPRLIGVLMLFAGFGWLTFLSPSLARDLSPLNMLPGVIGEGALTLWLLVFGVKGD